MKNVNFLNMKSKMFLPVLVAVAVILGVAAAFLFIYLGPRNDIRHFNGSLVKVEGDMVTLRGAYYSETEILPKNLSEVREFTFKVDGSTQFHKVTVLIPSREEVQKAGGQLSYNLNDRPKEINQGSLEDLALNVDNPNIFVETDFSESIYRNKLPVASRVSYRILSLPTFLPQ